MGTVPKPSLRPRTWWHNCFSIISFQSIGVITILTQPSLKKSSAVHASVSLCDARGGGAVLKDWHELRKWEAEPACLS